MPLLFVLLLVPLWVSAGEVYVNPAAAACSDYNPTTHTCGGGSATNYALTDRSGIKAWLISESAARDAGGTSTITLVGGDSLPNSLYFDISFIGNAWWLDLSGNECNGSAPKSVVIRTAAGREYVHFGAYREVPDGVWSQAYRPERDRPINAAGWGFKPNMSWVYKTTQLPEYSNTHGAVLVETDPDEQFDWSKSIEHKMLEAIREGRGKEFSDEYGVPWYSLRSSRKDNERADGRNPPVDKIWNFGDKYELGGTVYWLPSDGNHPANFRKGNQPRRVVIFRVHSKGIRFNGCTGGPHVEGIEFTRMGHPLEFNNSPNSHAKDIKNMFSRAEGYYAIEMVNSDNCTIEDAFAGLTNEVRVHRKDAYIVNESDGCLVADIESFMGGGHGVFQWQKATKGTVLGQRDYFAFGKALQTASTQDMWIGGYEGYFMMSPYCPEENVPANSPLGDEGGCQTTGIWMDGRQDEGHPYIHATGSNVSVFGTRLAGRVGHLEGGGIGATQWSVSSINPGKIARDGVVSGTFTYKTMSGEKYLERTDGNEGQGRMKANDNTGIRIKDDRFTAGNFMTVLEDFSFENNLCQDPLGLRYTAAPKHICYSFRLKTEPYTFSGRGISARNNMITMPDTGDLDNTVSFPTSGSETSCATFSADSEVSGQRCETTPVPVKNFPQPQSTGISLDVVGTHPGVDQGAARTTIKANVVSGTTVTIMDWRGFPDPDWHVAYQQTVYSEEFDELMLRLYPASEYLGGGLPVGSRFVQIGSQKLSYSSITPTGTGYEATLALDSTVSVSAGDLVHPMPFCGSAPDIGPEYCVVSDDVLGNPDFEVIQTSTTRSVDVLANDIGFGNCAGTLQIKAGSVSILGTGISSANIVGGEIEVTTGSTEVPSSRISYVVEGTGACAGIEDTAYLDLEIVGGAGSEQVYVPLTTGCDVEPGASGSWVTVDVGSCGVGANSGVFVWGEALSGASGDMGAREGDSIENTLRNVWANGQQSIVVPTNASDEIQVRKEADISGLTLLGSFAESGLVTWHEPAQTVALTCDGTWQTISGLDAGDLHIFRTSGETDGYIQFRRESGGLESTEGFPARYFPMLTVNASGNIPYKCPATNPIAELQRVLEIDSAAITVPSGDWQLVTPPTSSNSFSFTPNFTCAGQDGCVAYIVAGFGRGGGKRFNFGKDASVASNNEGNRSDSFFIVEPDALGNVWARVNNVGVELAVIGGFNSGAIVSADPLVWELSTCIGTNSLDGQDPDTAGHPGLIESDMNCNGAGHIDAGTGEHLRAQMGVSSLAADFSVSADGSYTWALNHDGYGTPGSAAANGGRLLMDFVNGLSRVELNGVTCGGTFQHGNVFPASSQVYARVETSGPPLNRSWQVWIEPGAIDLDVHQPRLTCQGVGGDGMVLQIAKAGSGGTIYLPIEVRSSQVVDVAAPNVPTVGLSVAGRTITVDIGGVGDPQTNSSSRADRIRVLSDTSPTPTTEIVDLLEGKNQTYSFEAPTAAIYYVDVYVEDPAGNESVGGDNVTTVSPNTAPVLGTPDTAVVPVGMRRSSEQALLDGAKLCNATDADGDELITVSISTLPAEAESATVQDGLVVYQHKQGNETNTTLGVTIGDGQGNETGECLIPIDPQAPPYVEPLFAFPDADAHDQEIEWTVQIWPFGSARPDEELGEVVFLYGNAVSSQVACPSAAGAHGFTCANFRVYLEPLAPGVVIDNMPALGTRISAGGWTVSAGPQGDYRVMKFPTIVRQD